jgi:hypothetical protein
MLNISAYHLGMMTGRTPNIDRLARHSFAALLALNSSGCRWRALVPGLEEVAFAS